jgi:phospholipid transport system transporter-binding protein
MKQTKSRGVKRVSSSPSTRGPRRPKQTVTENAPEFTPSMTAPPNAMANAAGDTPVRARVVLPVSCTIKEAESLKAHLLAQLDLPGPCEIEGGNVQHVDTAGVQLVLAFALDCLERNLPYVWKSRSQTFEDAVRVLGVGALLEYPG